MEISHTKKSTRVIIWVIAIVMAGGFVGSYFLLILQNNDAAKTQQLTNQTSQEALPMDPSAYKVEGKVEQLQVTDQVVGSGEAAKATDTVTVHYKGTIAQTGAKFDSSYDRGEPATFSLSGVIPGWRDGVTGMQVGGKRRLVIPSALAYGDQAQNGIPANSDLVFEVELLGVKPAEAAPAQ